MTPHKSILCASIAERLRSIVPDVPEPLMKEAGDDAGKRYLLKQASVQDQQNVIIGESLDELNRKADAANGRINAMEPKVERADRHVETCDHDKKVRMNWRIILFPLLTAILVFALQHFWK